MFRRLDSRRRFTEQSQEDLHLFHNGHFSSQIITTPGNNPETGVISAEFDDDDDDLGYYFDGVKRTLTDEQIAMFRHSEIQSLLRERRRRRENLDDENTSGASNDNINPVGGAHPDVSQKTLEKQPHSPLDSHQSGKRKWQRFIEFSESNPDYLTHRRIARELDEQKTKSIDLAYGDEEMSDAPPSKCSKATTPMPTARKQVVYADADGSVGHTEAPLVNSLPPKFIWPTLGAEDSPEDVNQASQTS